LTTIYITALLEKSKNCDHNYLQQLARNWAVQLVWTESQWRRQQLNQSSSSQIRQRGLSASRQLTVARSCWVSGLALAAVFSLLKPPPASEPKIT